MLYSIGRRAGVFFTKTLFRAIAPRLPDSADGKRAGALRDSQGRRTSLREAGVSSIDVAIIMIALITVGAFTTFALLSTALAGAQQTEGATFGALREASGSVTIRGGASAIRGSVDVDADNVIVISSSSIDQNAIVTVKFLVVGSVPDTVVDLTPPYTFDSSGTDPDASGLEDTSVMSFTTEDVAINEAAWSVVFIGTNDGDYFLEFGEKAEVTLWLQTNDIPNNLWDLGTDTGDPFLDLAAELLQTDMPFEIGFDVGGGVVTLGRTTPGTLDAIVYLE